ncbi:MAG: GNAT family N-acetyltransferase [Treponema sp.]|jgi:GNAT superfamily N-acetyltransferase|nr:GNAT family N-acetyltransferase [Treponema sp.]
MPTVYNKEGAALEVNLRPALPGDAPGIIRLIRGQYGENYMPSFYDRDWLAGSIARGALRFSVAELPGGDLGGMAGLDAEGHFPGSLILVLLLVDKALRGYGLGKLISPSVLEMASRIPCTCEYAHCLTVEPISQSFLEMSGFKMTGLLLNRYLLDPAAYYASVADLPPKTSHLIACKMRDKRDAGLLYVPEPYRSFAGRIYQALGAAYTLAPPQDRDTAAGPAEFSHSQTKADRHCELIIRKTGPGLTEALAELIEAYAALPRQSFNVFINMNDPGCPPLCAFLEEQGFFFTGLQPLSGANEYLLYHYAPGPDDPFYKVAVVPGFRAHLDWMRSLYRKSLS